MGNMVNSRAFFPPTPPTYNQDLEGIYFIKRKCPLASLEHLPPEQKAFLPPDRGIPVVLHKTPGSPWIIIFSHGNAEDLGQLQYWMHTLSRACNTNVISYDYQGYGLNRGIPCEQGAYEDIEAVYNHVTTDLKFSSDRIILMGRSLGSGPSTNLAYNLYQANSVSWGGALLSSCSFRSKTPAFESKNPLAGLILQSPIESAIRVVSKPLSYVPVDIFRNHAKIPYVQCPLMVIHGTDDGVVPFTHGQNLYFGSPNPYKLLKLDGAGHNDIEQAFGDKVITNLRNFLEALEPDTPTRIM